MGLKYIVKFTYFSLGFCFFLMWFMLNLKLYLWLAFEATSWTALP